MKFSTILKWHRATSRLRGTFDAPIPYEVRVPSGDSSPFFGNYVGQKYGNFDTNTCWNYGMTEMAETQLEIERSLGRFSHETLAWFKANGYIDEDDDFYLSRRWGAILSGVTDRGNDNLAGWKLAERFGLIPFTMLPYSIEDAADEATRIDFNDEYFDPKIITQEMRDMGQEFLKRVKIQSEELGSRWTVRTPSIIMDALKQAPLQIGVPVPGYAWNQEFVEWNGSKQPSHSIELYKYDTKDDPFRYFIYDSYEPHKKRLSSNYYVPIITRGIVTAISDEPMLSPTLSVRVWQRLVEILRSIGVLLGKVGGIIKGIIK